MDSTAENKVVYGLENAYYAKLTFGEGGEPTFATPVRLPGAVELSLEPKSNEVTFAADNDANYFQEEENQGYSGKLTIANVPLSFYKDILGEEENSTDGTMIEYADAKFSPFALLFQFDGDASKTRYVLYYCSASRVTIASKTGKDIRGAELNIIAKQLVKDNKKYVKAKTTSGQAAKYADWFKNVYLPTPKL